MEIDLGHDRFTVERGDVDGHDRVTVELWSRGSFGVSLSLSPGDAVSFGEALVEAGR